MMQGDVIQIRYPVLFTVKLLHHYFLDSKTASFDELSADVKVKMLAGYDVRSIFNIRPTKETARVLAGNGLSFKPHNMGFTVLTKQHPTSGGGGFDPPEKIPADTHLQFLLTVNDPLFYQYSAPFLKQEPSRIEKAATLGEQDKVFLKAWHLSNSVGTSATSLPPQLAKTPKSAALPQAPFSVESIMSVGGVVKQAKEHAANLTDAHWQTIFNGRFVSGEDLLEMEVTENIPLDTFAVIEIVPGDDIAKPEYRLYKPDNSLASPVFEIRIKNRSTWWRYQNQPQGQPPIPDTYLPLTAKTVTKVNGKDLPNANARTPLNRQLEPDNINTKRLFSDIYL